MTQFENKREYNLEDRTVQFSGELITFCKAWQKNVITLPLIN